MGWSIIGLTLIIKAVLFPLAYKSYVSMAKMKELQPQMEKLKEAAGDDRQKMQQGMMELYKERKGQPGRRVLAYPAANPDLFLPVQGDFRNNRAAPRTVDWLAIPRPVRS